MHVYRERGRDSTGQDRTGHSTGFMSDLHKLYTKLYVVCNMQTRICCVSDGMDG